MAQTPRTSSSSALGPSLVLLTSAAFTVTMCWFLVEDLRFVFAGVSVVAEAHREGDRTRLRFHGVEDGEYSALIGRTLDEGEEIPIRYLRGDPASVRLEEDVQPTWRWRVLWVMLGVVVTLFGVLLTWGRRPSSTRAWGRGRPGER